MLKAIALLWLTTFTLYAGEADDIIAKLEQNFRGDTTAYMALQMQMRSSYYNRTMKMQSWASGKQKSFIKITYPPKEYGITFLRLKAQMWQYVPKIERIIKIPPSMMLQSWMGSDITNDDMVKQSSLADDYDAKILEHNKTVVTIMLTPKADAAVLWGKIITTIDTTHYTPVIEHYYDDTNKEVRTFSYEQVKAFGHYFLPTIWRINPKDKPDHETVITILEAKFDKPISNSYFQKSALKRYAK